MTLRYPVITMLVGLVAGGIADWPTWAWAQARHLVPSQVSLFNSGKPFKNPGPIILNNGVPLQVYSAHSSGGVRVVLNASTPILEIPNIGCSDSAGCVLQISSLSSFSCPPITGGGDDIYFYTLNTVDAIQSDNIVGPTSVTYDASQTTIGNSSLLNSVTVAAGTHTVSLNYLARPIPNFYNKCKIQNVEMDVTVLGE